jgi:hypothetical protein
MFKKIFLLIIVVAFALSQYSTKKEIDIVDDITADVDYRLGIY